MLMYIGHKYPPLLVFWEGVTLVDTCTSMCRAVTMISNSFDVRISIGIKMLSALAVVNSSRNYIPQVRDNASSDKYLSFGIIVNSPGIAEAVCDHFKFVFGRVVAPYATINVHPLAL